MPGEIEKQFSLTHVPLRPGRRAKNKSPSVIFTSVLASVLVRFLSSDAFAAGADLDPSFTPGSGANDVVETIVVQPDGKLIVGGFFTNYNGTAVNSIARLNTNGLLDVTFNAGSGADASVFSAALQSDGKIVIGGHFTHVDGNPHEYTARLNTNGTVEVAYRPPQFLPSDGSVSDTFSDVHVVTLQPDDEALIGGPFGIARLAVDGQGDSPFNTAAGTNANATVFAIALQDNKIIIGGAFTNFNNHPALYLARLNSTGSFDGSFTASADGVVRAVVVQSDGKILIGGLFTHVNNTVCNNLARLNENGSIDASFHPGSGANDLLRTIAVQADGKILIGGAFTSYNGTPCNRIARLNPDGTLDPTFISGTGPNDTVVTTVEQPDGKVLIGGFFTQYGVTSRPRIARLLPASGKISFSSSSYSVGEGGGSAVITLTRTDGADGTVSAKINLADVTTSSADYVNTPGTLDTSFNAGPASSGFGNNVWTTIVQPDGKVLVGGLYFDYGSIYRQGIARLERNGVVDETFDPGDGPAFPNGVGGNAVVFALAQQRDGKILIGGDFTLYDDTPRNFVARLNTNGSLDATFDAGSVASQTVRDVVVQPDGKIIIAGDHISYGSNTTHIVRLNTNGSLDTSFQPPATYFPSITTMALQPDGKVVIGGDFQDYAGTGRNFIARLNANGSLDYTFDSSAGTNGVVAKVLVQPDGKIIIMGYYLLRLNSDGSPDSSFHPGSGPEDYVYGGALQPDGKIIIVGGFQAYDGVEREFVARINPNGSLDMAFDPGDSSNTGLLATTLTPDGEVMIGGAFNRFMNTPRRGIARLRSGDFFATWLAGDSSDKIFYLPIVDDVLPEGNETLNFGLTPLIGGASLGTYPNATLTIIDNEGAPPYMTWQQAHFTAGELGNPAISGDTADPDGDGLKNIVEYAFGLDPKIPTTDPTSGSVDANYVSIIYPKAIAATDVAFVVQKSTDMVNWTTVVPINVVLSDNGVIQVIKAQVAKAGAQKTYLRLAISH